MIDWNTRVVLSYRAEAWRDVWNVSFKISDGVDLTSAKNAIEAEVEAMASGHRGNHASGSRVGQRPKFVSIDPSNRTVLIEESAMLRD
jgi:hypothetical protein